MRFVLSRYTGNVFLPLTPIEEFQQSLGILLKHSVPLIGALFRYFRRLQRLWVRCLPNRRTPFFLQLGAKVKPKSGVS